MALSLVAGPFELELVNDMPARQEGYDDWDPSYPDPQEGQFSDVTLVRASVWHDAYGLITEGTWTRGPIPYSGGCFIRPDGKVVWVQFGPASEQYLIARGFIADTQQLAGIWLLPGTGGDCEWAELEPMAGVRRGVVRPLNRGPANPFGVMPDRIITADNLIGGDVARIYTVPLSDATTDPWDVEYEFLATTDVFEPHLAYAGTNDSGHHLWWVANAYDGQIFQYNATTQTEELGKRTCLGPLAEWWFDGYGYSVKHGLFFFVTTYPDGLTQRLYVFSPEPVAADIASPTLGASLVRGRRVRVSTTVLGDYGEPCPDRVVLFSSTTGELLPAAALTDEDGVATTVLQAPTTAPAGTETLTATLVE